MSDISEFSSYSNRIIDGLHEIARKAAEYAKEEFDKENKIAYKEFGVIQQEKIKKIYKKSVDEFYNAHPNPQYHRTKSLYNVLDLHLDDQGMVISNSDDYMDLYDESEMVTARNGSSLFDQVFVKGYHGGAASISGDKVDVWGAHPSPGIPYYRRPGVVHYPSGVTKWHRYGKWGHAATKTKSIYQMMIEDLGAAEGGEIFDEFKRVMDEHAAIAAKKVNQKIQGLQRELFG